MQIPRFGLSSPFKPKQIKPPASQPQPLTFGIGKNIQNTVPDNSTDRTMGGHTYPDAEAGDKV